ncbi:Ig-like domain-containing protein [Frigoribacterium salinisoli]
MSFVSAPARPRGRARTIAAFATAAVLAAVAVSAATPAQRVDAAGTLSCDQDTLYATGAAGQFVAIDLTTRAVTDVVPGTASPFAPANNGLGVARNGVEAFAFTNGAANGSSNVLARYAASTSTVSTVRAANPAGAPASTLRGAVDPVTGLYYYATGGDPATIAAYDPRTGTRVGDVGRVPGLQAGNGDFAFSTQGLLFIVASNAVYRLDAEKVPTTPGTDLLPASKLTDLPSGTNSPGIAFSSDGYLYVSTGLTIIKLDPSSGLEVSRFTTTAPGGLASYTDLASCNYANTLTGKSDVQGRWKAGDQFALAVTGGGLAAPSTATTSGSATGVQAQKAGAALAIPARTYTVSQTAGNATTRLADYSTTWSCVDVNSGRRLADGTGGTASLVFPAATTADGTDVDCTFVNTVAAVTASASDDSGSTATGTALSVPAPGVLANDAGTDLTVTSSTQPAHGTATVAPDGAWTYEPAKGSSGSDSFTYTTTDGAGGTSTSTVLVTVTPTSGDDAATARAGEALVVGAEQGVLANDAGSGLVASVASGPEHGSLVLGADGSYRYVPAKGFSGSDSFRYTATDASGATSTSSVAITVVPVAADDAVQAVSGRPATLTGAQLTANDAGRDLTVTGASAPTHGTTRVTPEGDVVYAPRADFSGTDTFEVTVTDASGRSSTSTVTVTVAPRAVDDVATAVAGTPLDVPAGRGLLANDDGSRELTAALGTAPAHGTVVVSPDGAFSYVPADSWSGTDTFGYVLTDASGGTSTGTVTVTVVPTAGDDEVTTDAGGAAHLDAPGVLADDRGTGLTAAITTAPQHGTATLSPDGTLDYVPAAGWSGGDTIGYRVTDASGGTATATVTLTVRPVAVDDKVLTDADRAVTTEAPGLLANDLGADLRVTDHGEPRHGAVTVDADGRWTYVPDAGTSGTDSFPYRVTDASGRTADAVAWIIVGDLAVADRGTATAGRRLEVGAAEGLLSNDRGTGLWAALDAPGRHGTAEVQRDGSWSYVPAEGFSGTDEFTYRTTDAEGQVRTGVVTVVVLPDAVDDTTATRAGETVVVDAPGVLGNDHGTDLTAELVDAPAHGTAVIGAGGRTSYTPDAGTTGTDVLTYRVTDREGRTDVATVTVHVGPIVVDDAPEGGTVEGEPLVVPADRGVLANDRGTDLTPVVTREPQHGTMTMDPDGSYTYTPRPGSSGRDEIGYEVTDGTGQKGTGTITIVVAPRAVDDVASTVAGRAASVAAPGVLGNDRGTGLAVTGVTPAAHGTVAIAPDGAFDYLPAPGWSGDDVVTYTVTDRDGGTATATVTVTVAPVAVPDLFATEAGTALEVPSGGLTGNDLGSDLRVTRVGDASTGTVTVRADGGLRYEPATGASGTDAFPYEVTDASGRTATSTVTVVVGARATDDAGSTRAGEVLEVGAADGLLANDAGTGLTAALDAGPQHGTVEVAGDGSWSYRPEAGTSGRDVFTYTATDREGQVRTGVVTVTVLPRAVDDAATTPAGRAVTLASPGATDNDLGTELRVTATGEAEHGAVTVEGGAVRYVPADGWSGIDRFDYTVTDRAGGTATATVTVTVGVVATDDAATTLTGRSMWLDPVSGVLGDDLGDRLSARLGEGPRHGSVELAADGSYSYLPVDGFTGTDPFTYVATDAAGQQATATVTITVLGAATATDDTVRGETGRPVTVDVTANDEPTEGASFDRGTVVLVDPATRDGVTTLDVPGRGTWTVVDGEVTFTPADGSTADASVRYRVTDSTGATVEASVTVDYPVVLSTAQLAFTGGASVLGIAALAMLGVAAGLLLARRGQGPVGVRRRSGQQ